MKNIKMKLKSEERQARIEYLQKNRGSIIKF